MSKLLFLTNELINPTIQKEMRLPLTFIAFGITEAKMYAHYNKKSNFIVPLDVNKRWGNDVVYGGLFLCKDFDFYSSILDAYHVCSMSTLKYNHRLDIHHRVNVEVTPIYFRSLEELSRLKYKEGEPINAETYMGNTNHTKISQRLKSTYSYRIIDGIDENNFKKLFGEVTR